jgi:hypothetical protein
MIINDTHRFAFVHIPKCAGTSVRKQLEAFDKYEGAFDAKVLHPALGSVHLAHLPLDVLREHYPEAFDEISRYRSFAVLRDPKDRFISAIRQRLREFRGVPDTLVTNDVIMREADEVLNFLYRCPDTLELEYVHFMKQCSFVYLGRSRIIETLCTVDDLSPLARFVQENMGIQFDLNSEHNVSKNLRSPLVEKLVTFIRPAAVRVMPPKAKEFIWSKMVQAGLYENSRSASKHSDAIASLEAAIEAFYSEDRKLFDAAKQASGPLERVRVKWMPVHPPDAL